MRTRIPFVPVRVKECAITTPCFSAKVWDEGSSKAIPWSEDCDNERGSCTSGRTADSGKKHGSQRSRSEDTVYLGGGLWLRQTKRAGCVVSSHPGMTSSSGTAPSSVDIPLLTPYVTRAMQLASQYITLR